MHFSPVFVAAAIVFNFFGKIADFAAGEKFGGVDVLAFYVGSEKEKDYQLPLLNCLKETFSFGPNVTDSRFAVACSDPIIGLYDGSYQKMSSHFSTSRLGCIDLTPPGRATFGKGLAFLKKHMDKHHEFRINVSVVTIIFGDQYLINDLDQHVEAMFFVNPPNQMYLAVEKYLTINMSNLAINGIVSNHLLKFTQGGNCTDFAKQFQDLMCRDIVEKEQCEPKSGDPNECEMVKTYKPSSLSNAEVICKDALEERGDKCTCTSTGEIAHADTSSRETEADTVADTVATEGTGLTDTVIAGIVVGVIIGIIVLVAIAIAIWFFVFRRSGGTSGQAGATGGSQAAGAAAGGSQMSPSQRAEAGASQKSVSKPAKSVSQQPQKSTKSMGSKIAGGSMGSKVAGGSMGSKVGGGSMGSKMTKTDGSKIAKSGMGKK